MDLEHLSSVFPNLGSSALLFLGSLVCIQYVYCIQKYTVYIQYAYCIQNSTSGSLLHLWCLHQHSRQILSDSACGNLASKTTRTHLSEGKLFLNLLNSTSRGGKNCRVSPSPLAEVITHSGFLAHASPAVLIPL